MQIVFHIFLCTILLLKGCMHVHMWYTYRYTHIQKHTHTRITYTLLHIRVGHEWRSPGTSYHGNQLQLGAAMPIIRNNPASILSVPCTHVLWNIVTYYSLYFFIICRLLESDPRCVATTHRVARKITVLHTDSTTMLRHRYYNEECKKANI